MKSKPLGLWLLAIQLAGGTASFGGSQELLDSLEPPSLAEVVTEVFERNPDLAHARYRAAAAAARAPQARALPDPVASLTWFALPRENRTGPEQLGLVVSQRFPGFGKLPLAEQAALHAAEAAAAEVETARLDLLTEARRYFLELAYHDLHRSIVEAELDSLTRYELAARARYSAGTGAQQDILHIQAQITRIDARLLDIEQRETRLLASLNALRDREYDKFVDDLALPFPDRPALFEHEALVAAATQERPELAAAAARIAQARALAELAEKQFRPELELELGYTLVGKRDDPASRVLPPPDDGDDVLWLTGSVNLPVRRRKLEAGLEEALANVRAAEEERRRVEVKIARDLGGLVDSLPVHFNQWRKVEEMLTVQAREALRSAEAAYAAGTYTALDLLESEMLLLEVRTTSARILTDYLLGRVELDRAVARPMSLMGARRQWGARRR